MVLTESTIMPQGSKAPEFTLPDTRTDKPVSLSQYANQPVLIAFICNHCPYVVHLVDEFASCARQFESQGIATIAISANDAISYPADSPANMAALAQQKGFEFPYCHDESQSVARAFDAVCTPDLYLFDADHRLYYRGQFDSTRPGQGTANGQDLKSAAAALLANQSPPADTRPSVGCSIKWKR